MKRAIYLGTANGIKNLVTNKQYPVEYEADEVVILTNENGKKISYSKRFFRIEEDAPPPPPPPPAPISSALLAMEINEDVCDISLELRDERIVCHLNLDGSEISCGVKQLYRISSFLRAIQDLINSFNIPTREERVELTTLLTNKFIDELIKYRTGLIIFSISEESGSDCEDEVYETFLETLDSTSSEKIQRSDWVLNPNSGNDIILYIVKANQGD